MSQTTLDIGENFGIRPSAPLQKYRFSGHETFPFRYTWLTKGVQHLLMYPDLFHREDDVVILGVGKNMVKSIRHWCETLGLISPTGREREHRPTPLGLALFQPKGWDPYLEDNGTLWLLHWLLASRLDRASTWCLAFTHFNGEFLTRETLTAWLVSSLAHANRPRVTISSLKRDVDVFIRTYVSSKIRNNQPLEDSFECPLTELGLLREVDTLGYQFVRGSKTTLPDIMFVYAIIDFWGRSAPQQRTISFEKILFGSESPGAAFKLSENALVERLEKLPRWSGMHYDDTAGMRLVIRSHSLEELELLHILERYYVRQSRESDK